MDPEFMTTKELCEELGIKKSTLFRWRAKGTAPIGHMLGPRKLCFKRAEVDLWLAARRGIKSTEVERPGKAGEAPRLKAERAAGRTPAPRRAS